MVLKWKQEDVAEKAKKAEGEVVMVYVKKTPAQKIRDYFKKPKWERLTKRQENQYGRV